MRLNRSVLLRGAAALATLAALLSPSAVADPAPASLSRNDVAPLDRVPVHRMPPVDVPTLLTEDLANAEVPGLPLRVGWPMATHLSPAADGAWEELPGVGQVWRLAIESPGARWLVVGFDDFRLRPGASLFVFDGAGRTVLGPFTASDVRDHGELWSPPIDGDRVVIELIWPEALRGLEPRLHLGTVSHGYKSWTGADDLGELPGPGDTPELQAGACNIDVNCPLGADWQDEKRGVTRILIGGSGLCSGSLINNTAQDCRPFFLTAAHCLSSQSAAASTTFLFNYERPFCESGVAPTNQTLTGSSLRATYSPSDFTLLELNQVPPLAYAPYYNGWSRSTAAPPESTCIHHPSGDEKKITHNDDPLVNGQNWGPDHWRITEWEQGTTEGGSSGSPLFDHNSRIVGQLHGGTASCSSLTYDEYGKLDVSWTGGGSNATRLSNWLDPIGTGTVTMDGIDLDFCLSPRAVLDVVGQTATETSGNLDGAADPGESIELRVTLKNRGNLGATTVLGTLTAADPLAVVSENPAGWPDIASGGEQTSLAPHFSLQLDPAWPCGQPLDLTLSATALEVTAPGISAISLPTGTPQVAEHFRDEMESGPAGWTSQALIGTESWSLVTADSYSPSHSWFLADVNLRRDTVLRAPTLVALPTVSVLRFAHRYNLSSGEDGAVLETSIDGGASWQDAGPRITQNGYTGSVPPNTASALAGRTVWSGDSGGWRIVTVDLSALAGEDVDLRWRLATNLFTLNEGWYVDDVVVDRTSFTCDALALPPGEAGTAGGLRIDPDPAGYRLAWSAPDTGGAAMGYRLYGLPLGQPLGAPSCEADLGPDHAAVVPSLPDGHGFLVVGVNSLGEGSYGKDSAGNDRAPAQGGAVCP